MCTVVDEYTCVNALCLILPAELMNLLIITYCVNLYICTSFTANITPVPCIVGAPAAVSGTHLDFIDFFFCKSSTAPHYLAYRRLIIMQTERSRAK